MSDAQLCGEHSIPLDPVFVIHHGAPENCPFCWVCVEIQRLEAEKHSLFSDLQALRESMELILGATRDDNPVAISGENLMNGINMIAREALSALDTDKEGEA